MGNNRICPRSCQELPLLLVRRLVIGNVARRRIGFPLVNRKCDRSKGSLGGNGFRSGQRTGCSMNNAKPESWAPPEIRHDSLLSLCHADDAWSRWGMNLPGRINI